MECPSEFTGRREERGERREERREQREQGEKGGRREERPESLVYTSFPQERGERYRQGGEI